MTPAFAGAPPGATPDPRYLVPYDNPVATPYPAAVSSPGAAIPEIWQTKKPNLRRSTRAPASRRRPQDQFFKSRDRNRDGGITLKEFIGNPAGRNVPALTRRFKQFDSNGDGMLKLDELKTGRDGLE